MRFFLKIITHVAVIISLLCSLSVFSKGLYHCYSQDTLHIFSSCCLDIVESCCLDNEDKDDASITEKCCDNIETIITIIPFDNNNLTSNKKSLSKSFFYAPFVDMLPKVSVMSLKHTRGPPTFLNFSNHVKLQILHCSYLC